MYCKDCKFHELVITYKKHYHSHIRRLVFNLDNNTCILENYNDGTEKWDTDRKLLKDELLHVNYMKKECNDYYGNIDKIYSMY